MIFIPIYCHHPADHLCTDQDPHGPPSPHGRDRHQVVLCSSFRLEGISQLMPVSESPDFLVDCHMGRNLYMHLCQGPIPETLRPSDTTSICTHPQKHHKAMWCPQQGTQLCARQGTGQWMVPMAVHQAAHRANTQERCVVFPSLSAAS